MDNMEFRSAVSTYIWILTAVCAVLGILSAVYPFVSGDFDKGNLLFFFIIGIPFLITALICILSITSTKYIFSSEGMMIKSISKHFMFREEYLEGPVPYDVIIRFWEVGDLTDVSYSVALSRDALLIEYTKKNGRKDSFTASPKDKARFMAELSKRTGLTASCDPRRASRR